jgi:hypothetical protein
VSVDESGDVSAEVHIEVTGIGSLQDAAEAADELDGSLDSATGSAEGLDGALDELGDAAPGIEADAEAAGHLRDNLAEVSPAAAAAAAELDALNSSGRKLESGGLYQTLTEIRDAMADMDRDSELTIFKGMNGGFGIKPPAEQFEDELGNLFNSPTAAAGPAELEEQLEALGREMGTFETPAAKYLHTVQEIRKGTSDLFLNGQASAEAAKDSFGDLSGTVDDAWTSVSRLEGAVWLGDNAISAVENDTQRASAAFSVLARTAQDAEDATGGGEGGIGLLSGLFSGGGGEFEMPGGAGQVAMWGSIAGLIGGAVSVLTPFAAGLVSFAAMGAPALEQVYKGWTNVSAAQSKYQAAVETEKADPTASNLTAQKTALKELNAAYAAVPPSVRPAISSIHDLITTWEQASKSSGIQQDMLRDIPKIGDVLKGAIPATTSLGKSFAPLFSGWLTDLEHWQKSAGGKSFISDLTKDMPGAAKTIQSVGDALGGVVGALTKPGAAKAAESMFSGIAGAMKSLTPGAVDQLQKAETIMAGASKDVQSGTKKGGFLQEFARGWDDNADVTRDFEHWTVDAPKSILGTLFTHPNELGDSQAWKNFWLSGQGKPTVAFGTQHQETVAGDIGDIMAGNSPDVKAAGAKAGTDYMSGFQESMEVKDKGKMPGLTALQAEISKDGTAAGKGYGAALSAGIGGASAGISGKTKAISSDIKTDMAVLGPDGHAAGTALGNGLALGIQDSTPAAVAAATEMANEITAAVKTAHQVASPSKLFYGIGVDDVTGLIMGLEEGKLTLAEVIKDLDPTKALKSLIESARDYASSIVQAAEAGASLSTMYGETGKGQLQAGAVQPVYANMADAMKANLKQLKDFDDDIRKLKDKGLSKTLLEQLIAAGPSDLGEARALLAGGKGYIDEIDDLQKQIAKYSDKLGSEGVKIKDGAAIGKDIAAGMAPDLHQIVSAIKNQKTDVKATVNLTVKLDGKTLGRQVQSITLQHAARNLSSGLKLPTRGA